MENQERELVNEDESTTEKQEMKLEVKFKLKVNEALRAAAGHGGADPPAPGRLCYAAKGTQRR